MIQIYMTYFVVTCMWLHGDELIEIVYAQINSLRQREITRENKLFDQKI